MKTRFIILFNFVYLSVCWSNVWQGDYHIQSLAEVKSFPVQCNCTSIEGDLKITFNIDEDFTHLDSLYVLQEVGGSVLIIANHRLQSLNGLNNLASIGKTLKITHNTDLTQIDGFNNLEQIGGSLIIDDNRSLTGITGFEKLQHIEENFVIELNEKITHIEGFKRLQKIEGNCVIFENENLKNIIAFEELHTINGDIKLENNFKLEKITGFQELQNLNGSFQVLGNIYLSDIEGFEKLVKVGGDLKVSFAASSKKIFNNIQIVEGNLYISGFRSVENIDMFNSLKEVNKTLSIHFNSNLTALSGFENLEIVNVLSIHNNNNLQEINTFDKVQYAYRITIEQNENLRIIPSFSNLKNVGIVKINSNFSLTELPDIHLPSVEELQINGNINLMHINGFNKLRKVHRLVDISANNNLLSLQGFSELTYLPNLLISNRNLRQLDAFVNLKVVDDLRITDNIQLISIENFSNIKLINDSLVLSNNLQLNECCLINCWIKQSGIDEHLVNLNLNGKECSQIYELENQCINNNCKINKDEITDLNILKNPSTHSLNFTFIVFKDQPVSYSIYNLKGQLFKQGTVSSNKGFNTKTVDLPNAQKGFYMLLLENEESIKFNKFIKL